MAKVCMVVMNNFLRDARVYKEAQTLAAAGHQVMVVAMKTPQAAAYEEMGGFVVKRIDLRTRPWPKWLPVQIIKYLEFVFRVLQEVRLYRPDILHAHDFPALPIGWLAAKIAKAKSIYDSHEFWLGLENPLFASRVGKWLVKLVEGGIIRRVDIVITINQTIAEKLSEIHNIPHPIIVMNAQPLSTLPQRDKLGPRLGLDSDTRTVIYAASIRPHRGLEQLIGSVQYLNKDTVLVLMGPDKMGGSLQKYAQELGVQSRVRFIPPVPQEEVASYVAFADVGVIASQSTCLNRYYGLGNKLFHYIAAGIPVAVSNQPERRRIVQEYDIGVVFDETNPRDIAQKIDELLQNRDLNQKMRENARKVHTTVLNWENEAQTLCQAYEELIQK